MLINVKVVNSLDTCTQETGISAFNLHHGLGCYLLQRTVEYIG